MTFCLKKRISMMKDTSCQYSIGSGSDTAAVCLMSKATRNAKTIRYLLLRVYLEFYDSVLGEVLSCSQAYITRF